MKVIDYKKVRISVKKESNGTWTVSFPGIRPKVKPLKGFKSKKKAIREGKAKVRQHRWKNISPLKAFEVKLRNNWKGTWDIEVNNAAGGSRRDNIPTRMQALQQAWMLIAAKVSKP
ncbi:MAG: hypothetical protein ACPGO5_05425 [Patescibacteria group bacterium]